MNLGLKFCVHVPTEFSKTSRYVFLDGFAIALNRWFAMNMTRVFSHRLGRRQ